MGQGLTRRRFVATGSAALAALYAAGGGRPARAAQAGFTLPGLSAPGEILVDRWGIPHIYGATQPDAFLLQGFNAARDRLWQIDLWRRRGLGRLSAALGAGYVEQDRAARLFLYRGDLCARVRRLRRRRRADRRRVRLGHQRVHRRRSQRGTAPLPVEFEALGYRPERWAAEDARRGSAATGSSPTSATRWRARSSLRDHGRKAEALRPQAGARAGATKIPDGLDLDAIPDDVLDVYDLAIAPVEFAAPGGEAPRPRPGRARTTGRCPAGAPRSGRPILANDPHRTQGVPSLRYLAHLLRARARRDPRRRAGAARASRSATTRTSPSV